MALKAENWNSCSLHLCLAQVEAKLCSYRQGPFSIKSWHRSFATNICKNSSSPKPQTSLANRSGKNKNTNLVIQESNIQFQTRNNLRLSTRTPRVDSSCLQMANCNRKGAQNCNCERSSFFSHSAPPNVKLPSGLLTWQHPCKTMVAHVLACHMIEPPKFANVNQFWSLPRICVAG